MKKNVLRTAICLSMFAGTTTSSQAALNDGAILAFNPGVRLCLDGNVYPNCTTGSQVNGSYFGMASIKIFMEPGPDRGIIIGQAQWASGSHGGFPNGSESPGIDSPWGFFGSTGMDFTNLPTVVIDPDVNNDGGFTQALDIAWAITWNGIPEIPIPMIATVVCDQADCANGSNFVLDMASPIPPNPGHGFGGVPYLVHLEGTVIAPSLIALATVGPDVLNVASKGIGFSVTFGLEDIDGSSVDVAGVNLGVDISSINGITVPAGSITENAAATIINGDGTITVTYNDSETGTRQDIIAAVSDTPDGGTAEICIAGTAQDASAETRDFGGCDDIVIRSKGNR